MCSTTVSAGEILGQAGELLAALPDGRRGLGSPLADEVLALRALCDRVEAAYLARLALLDHDLVPGGGKYGSTQAWLRGEAGLSATGAKGDVRLANRLHGESLRPLPALAAAFGRG